MKTNTPKIVGVPVGTVNNQTSNPVSVTQRDLSQSDTVTQRDLVELAKLGSPSAFKQLIESNHQKLYGLVYNMIHSHEDTEDILQEAYQKAHRSLHNFKGDSSFSTWIHRIASNCAINQIRKKKKMYNFSIDDVNSNVTRESKYIEATTTTGADRKLIIEELGNAINDAINKLSTSHRQVVQWFDIDGLSHNEIASRLGINANTVRTRLFYAHKMLQSMLSQYKEVI